MFAPAGLTDINEDTVWPNATSTFLTNQEWRLIYMSPTQMNTTHHELVTERQTPALHASCGRLGVQSPPPWLNPASRLSHIASPQQRWPCSASPDTSCVPPSRPTDGSEKYLQKMRFYPKERVKLRSWDLQKSCSVPAGWKHIFVSQFLLFCLFKRKFLGAVWLVSVVVLTSSGEGIKSMQAVLHKQLTHITFRHPESTTFSTSLQHFFNNQGTVKFF